MNRIAKVPEEVIGISDETGELKYLIKYQGLEDCDLLDAKQAHAKLPQLLLKFYREKLEWHDGAAKRTTKRTKKATPKKQSKKSEEKGNGNGVAHGKVPEEILGAKYSSRTLKFLIKWIGIEEADLIVADEAHLLCPELLLKWYEDRITWRNF